MRKLGRGHEGSDRVQAGISAVMRLVKMLLKTVATLTILVIVLLVGAGLLVRAQQERARNQMLETALARETLQLEAIAARRPPIVVQLSRDTVQRTVRTFVGQHLNVLVMGQRWIFRLDGVRLDLRHGYAVLWLDLSGRHLDGNTRVRFTGPAEVHFIGGPTQGTMRMAVHAISSSPTVGFGAVRVRLPGIFGRSADAGVQGIINEIFDNASVNLQTAFPLQIQSSDLGPIRDLPFGDNAHVTIDVGSSVIEDSIPLLASAPIIDDNYIRVFYFPQGFNASGNVVVPPAVPMNGDAIVRLDSSLLPVITARLLALSHQQRSVSLQSSAATGRIVRDKVDFPQPAVDIRNAGKNCLPVLGARPDSIAPSLASSQWPVASGVQLADLTPAFTVGGIKLPKLPRLPNLPLPHIPNPFNPDPRNPVPHPTPGCIPDPREILAVAGLVCPIEYEAHLVNADALSGTLSLMDLQYIQPWGINLRANYAVTVKIEGAAEPKCLPVPKAKTTLEVRSAASVELSTQLGVDANRIALTTTGPAELALPYTIKGGDILKDKNLGKWRWPDLEKTAHVNPPSSIPLLVFRDRCSLLELLVGTEEAPFYHNALRAIWNIEDARIDGSQLVLGISSRVSLGPCKEANQS